MYLEMFKLDGRVALVTGGGARSASPVSRLWRKPAPRSIIADFDEKVAAEGQAAMKAKGHTVETVMMDVTKTDQVNKVADDVVKRHGKIDILVNNAGIAPQRDAGGKGRRRALAETSSTSTSTAPSGAAAPSASTCWPRNPAPSSISARCPASSSTSRRSRPTTMPPRRACITSPSRWRRSGVRAASG